MVTQVETNRPSFDMGEFGSSVGSGAGSSVVAQLKTNRPSLGMGVCGSLGGSGDGGIRTRERYHPQPA